MLYYKATKTRFMERYPYVIPKDTLLTENELKRYHIMDLKETLFTPVNIKSSKTEKLWYDFRYEKEVKN